MKFGQYESRSSDRSYYSSDNHRRRVQKGLLYSHSGTRLVKVESECKKNDTIVEDEVDGSDSEVDDTEDAIDISGDEPRPEPSRALAEPEPFVKARLTFFQGLSPDRPGPSPGF